MVSSTKKYLLLASMYKLQMKENKKLQKIAATLILCENRNQKQPLPLFLIFVSFLLEVTIDDALFFVKKSKIDDKLAVIKCV